MKRPYFILAAAVMAVGLLLTFLFAFLEKESRRRFVYTVEVAGETCGWVKTDRYKTEERLVYKSESSSPLEIDRKTTWEKIVFDRKNFEMENFAAESKNFGAAVKTVYVTSNGETLNFLSKAGSKFCIASGIRHAKGISVFDAESMLTYMPFIDRYDFARGGTQSFDALYIPESLLAPARGKIIFTSIRDEYIDVAGKKTKTECLTVKAKKLPATYVWVAKNDRSIARLKIKDGGLLIKRAAFLPEIGLRSRTKNETPYDSCDVLFPSGNIALAGTIAVPRKAGKFPPVLLVTGEGPYDRENAGLYTAISDELAGKNYLVLRFDKPGIGKSQGEYLSVGISSEIEAIENALKFLLNHEKAEKERAFIIAHSDSCSYLPRLGSSGLPVAGIVMLGVAKPSPLPDPQCKYVADIVKTLTAIDGEYPAILDSSTTETLNLITNTNNDYAFTQGRHVFIRRMAQLKQLNPVDDIKKLKTRVIIICGKKDSLATPAYIKDIEKALYEAPLAESSAVYFRDLGHFLGKLVSKPGEAKYYKLEREVLETITNWLGIASSKPEAPETPAAAPESPTEVDIPRNFQ